MGEDHIPPKFVKIAGEFLAEPLTNIINCCFYTSTFPDRENGGTVKHDSTNYRPIQWSTGEIKEIKINQLKKNDKTIIQIKTKKLENKKLFQ